MNIKTFFKHWNIFAVATEDDPMLFAVVWSYTDADIVTKGDSDQ